jgi:hypothetical protein
VIDTHETDIVLDDGSAASQIFNAVWQISKEINEDDTLSFFFEVDLPRDYLSDGVYIFQYAQLTDVVNSSDEKISFACAV